MRNLLATLMMLVLATGIGLLPASSALSAEYDAEGKYKRIKPARPLEQTDKVEVVDVFWYGCPHCYSFLPYMRAWEAAMPEYVEIRRLPVIFRDSFVPHARAYYTAELLSRDEELHPAVFQAMHSEKRPLNSREELRRFYVEHGVDGAEFDATYDSFSVDAMARQSEVMARRWGVQGTPSVIVNGRYLISGSTAGSHEDVIKVLEVLVEREHKAMAERSAANQGS